MRGVGGIMIFMKENPIHSLESKESKKELFENMQKARDVCMVIYGRMMTGDMSVQKAQQMLDETFIDSGLLAEINNSNVSAELKRRIMQALEDPYLIPELSNNYDLANSSLENLFVGALGLVEGESSDLEIEDENDRIKISQIFDDLRSITHNEVLDITYKNYFLGRCPGDTGTIVSKLDGEWKQVEIADGNLEAVTDPNRIRFSPSDVEQIRRHGEKLVAEIKKLTLDIKLFLADRSGALPEKMVEILKDVLEELKQMTSQSMDETQPSVVDYTGSGFQGRFAYTGIVEKELRYRNFLQGNLVR